MTKKIRSRQDLVRGRAGRQGFTLIELVITMVIASILVAIAIPTYSTFIRKGRRTDAKSALLDLASLEERYFSTANAYSSTASDLGYGAAVWPITVGSGYYQIQKPVLVAAVAPTAGVPAGTPASFTITAVAIGTQLNDTDCLSFTVTSTGAQTANPDAAGDCWK